MSVKTIFFKSIFISFSPLVCHLQVDTGSAGGVGHDRRDQSCCLVLLLLRYRLSWSVAADVPQEGPALSANTGTTRSSLRNETVFEILRHSIPISILLNSSPLSIFI